MTPPARSDYYHPDFRDNTDSFLIEAILVSPAKLRSPMPTPGGAVRVFAEKQQNKPPISAGSGSVFGPGKDVVDSPMRLPEMHKLQAQPSLLDQVMPEEQWADDDLDFGMGLADSTTAGMNAKTFEVGALKKPNGAGGTGGPKDVLGDKENIIPPVAAR